MASPLTHPTMTKQEDGPGEPAASAAPTPTKTPFLEDQLWVNIASRVDDVLALGRLACVARRFKWVVEQAASLTLAQRPQFVQAWVPPQAVAEGGVSIAEGGVSNSSRGKLQLLHEANTLMQPLCFDIHGPGVQLDAHGAVAASCGVFQSAVCARQMRAGIHAAEFMLVSGAGDVDTSAGNDIGSWVGVVGVDFDAAAGSPAMNSGGCSSAMLYTLSSPQLFGAATTGDVVGLEIDFRIGSISVQLNGAPCGSLVESGIQGPLRWACDVGYGGAVRLTSRQQPSPPQVYPALPEGVVPERPFRLLQTSQ